MIKQILLVAVFALVAHNLCAQNQFDELNTRYEQMADSLNLAGKNLVGFSNQAQWGIGLMIAGTLVSWSHTLVKIKPDDPSDDLLKKQKKIQEAYIVTGTIISTAGFITWVFSYNRARTAGKTLMRINPDGVGVAIPIK